VRQFKNIFEITPIQKYENLFCPEYDYYKYLYLITVILAISLVIYRNFVRLASYQTTKHILISVAPWGGYINWIPPNSLANNFLVKWNYKSNLNLNHVHLTVWMLSF